MYRYTLTREWEYGSGRVNWIMLNPSTADNDPTIRRVIGFSKKFGFRSLIVTNLFAYRATNPKELRNAFDPVGPKNDYYLLQAASNSNKIICAWGATRTEQPQYVCKLLHDYNLYCLGLTVNGHPKHPLYLHSESKLYDYLRRT